MAAHRRLTALLTAGASTSERPGTAAEPADILLTFAAKKATEAASGSLRKPPL